MYVCNAMQCDAMRCDAMRCDAMAWHGMAWHVMSCHVMCRMLSWLVYMHDASRGRLHRCYSIAIMTQRTSQDHVVCPVRKMWMCYDVLLRLVRSWKVGPCECHPMLADIA